MIRLPKVITADAAPEVDEIYMAVDGMGLKGSYAAYAAGFNAAIEKVQRLNATAQPVSDGWVRCTDSLPDSEGKYLVYETLNNRVNHDYWMEPEPAEGFWNHYDTSVTHWMPLPAAPGGQDD